jgi:hypothetical protein
MAFCEYLASALLNEVLGGTAYTPPTSFQVGLLGAATWLPSTSIAAGVYAVGSTLWPFNSTNRHIYVCTTAGTTGSTEPTWNQTTAGTTTDNTVTWTECTNYFGAANFTQGGGHAELQTGNSPGYARVASYANSTANWPATTTGGTPPITSENAVAITFPNTPSGTWLQAVGFILLDQLSNYLMWQLLTSAIVAGVASGPPSFAINALQVTLQ